MSFSLFVSSGRSSLSEDGVVSIVPGLMARPSWLEQPFKEVEEDFQIFEKEKSRHEHLFNSR